MYIAIAGNIGSGKTTLTQLIADKMNCQADFDDSNNNPYIYDFYADMQRWAFHLQVYFLNHRFRRIVTLRQQYKNIVQDRTVFEDAYVFAKNLHGMQLLNTTDYNTYIELFQLLTDLIPPPDLVIYLKAPVETLLQQIEGRGRAYEKGIRIDYLNSLNNHYNHWFESYTGEKMVIEAGKYNFSENPKDCEEIIKIIKHRLL